MKGYAWSGGGRQIIRVDVSADGGKRWHTADLLVPAEHARPPRTRAWAWAPWSVSVPLPEELRAKAREQGGRIELLCKATDDNYNSQPDTVAPVWNIKGVLNNSWHRVQLKLPADASAAAAAAPSNAAPAASAAPAKSS